MNKNKSSEKDEKFKQSELLFHFFLSLGTTRVQFYNKSMLKMIHLVSGVVVKKRMWPTINTFACKEIITDRML